MLELIEDLLGSLLGQLDQQRFRTLHVIGGDEQVIVVGGDLDDVVPLAQLLALPVQHDPILIQVFRLPNDGALPASHGGLLGTQGLVLRVVAIHAEEFVVHTLRADPRESDLAFLPIARGEVVESASALGSLDPLVDEAVVEDVGVLADHFSVASLVGVLSLPLIDTVGCLFLLESL